MAHMVIGHQVEDYGKWRAAYDAHADIRDGAGESRVYQDVAEPNRVTVVVDGELDKLRAFMSMPELKTVMKEAGVIGEPQVMFVNDVT